MRCNPCHAVSAVVGAMVLLSLLIVIAALLSAYAGGLVRAPAHAPSAELAVYTAGGGPNFSIIFEHRSGEALSPGNTQIVTFVDDKEGIFMLSEIQIEKFYAGSKVTTPDRAETAKLMGLTTEELVGYIANRTPVEISVYDLPSGSVIYRSNIILEEK
ncbi:type IV pilin N-terminal domain-containing protein [Methanolacinia petrolearia]|uniref:type IV pilin N-terminal domain-containing protein n=1 Tax=Methanolacinia petrolearia TaxID=54120 RepID=UPI003BAA8D78